ncbi:hypothetical protein BKA61DRAFT_582924 [Leptodontidium sp. MPI-SDFR-AT-0119]|nr:hypothetical protein BKA61DRAFT_582924 [Leptodontidium sp. MPI-SDFR-AT-0119]
MSAAKYLTKVLRPNAIPKGESVTKLLAQIPLVHPNALEIIWPASSEYDIALLMVDLSNRTSKSLDKQAIRSLFVDNPPSIRPGPGELEVVGLKEFLAITALDINLKPIGRRLREIAKHRDRVSEYNNKGVLLESIKPVDVLEYEEAVDILLV